MKRFTKALSMFLAIIMVIGLLPLSIIADDIQSTHTVWFKLNYNGAHKIPSQKVADGECAVQPEDVTREGWIFEYWYVKTGDGIQKFDLSQPITEDVTLYARWDEDITYWGPIWSRNILNGIAESEKEDEPETDGDDVYTVTFDPNGSGVENIPEPQKVKSGECAVMPASPTKADGSIFGGWYTEASCENIFDFATPITEDKTLYAFWFVYDETMEILAEALSAVRIGYADANNADCVTQNITLPTEITIDGLEETFTVNWSSDNSAVSADGTVTRSNSENVEVKLTAEITYKGETAAREITVVVIKENQETPIVVDDIEDMYQFNEDGTVPDVYIDDNDNISNIDGVFSNVTVNCCEDAILAVESVKNILGIENPTEELAPSNTVNSNYSNSYTVQQMYKGIPVYGRTITVSTTLEGTPNYLNTGYLSNLDVNTSPVLSENKVVEILTADYNSEYTYNVDGLTIYSINEYVDAPVLAYIVKVTDADGEFVENLIVNSNDGTIVYKEVSEIYWGDANVVGKGKDELGNERTFTIRFKQWDWFFYYMQDVDRNIMVYNNKVSSSNRVGSEFNIWLDKSENSVYANLIHVYDWYKDNLNEDSYDDHGEIKLVAHADGATYNACWSGNNTIKFFDNEIFNPRGWYHSDHAGLDIMAHEYTHGVVEYRVGNQTTFPYSGQTGAINEAYADIFGCIVDGDWEHADDVREDTRNIADPSQSSYTRNNTTSSYPTQYMGTGWVTDTDSFDYGGVHINCTVLSHAAYLMNQAGISTDTLAELWYESMGYGYNASSKFYNVRLNVVHAAKDMGLSENQLTIINKAFDDVNVKIGYTLSGKITIADDDTDMTNNQPLQGAKVRLTGNNVIKSAVTDANGNYKINNIPYGTYTVTVSKDGYITVTQTLEFDYTMEEVYNAAIEAIPEEYEGDGIASGYVYDVATGYGVPNMTLYVRAGLNNTVGSSFMTLTTNSSGKYSTFSIPAGNYTIQVVDERTGITEEERYISSSFNIKILGGMTIGNQNGYVSNGVASEELRIVLTWGSTPSDLDSHLVGPTADGSKFHVYYSDKTHGTEADLDVDDTSSYGPETVTIHSFNEGIYTYAIHDYSNRSSSYSTAMANSGAQVKVYRGAELLKTYNVPANMDGTLWTVFTYNPATKQITTVNTMSYDSSSGGSLMTAAEPMMLMSARPAAAEPANEVEEYDYEEVVMIITEDIFSSVKD